MGGVDVPAYFPPPALNQHRYLIFHIIAETMGQYLKKGAKVYVEGRLQTRSWEGRDGQRRTAIEVVAGDLIMLDSRSAPRHAGPEEETEVTEDIAF